MAGKVVVSTLNDDTGVLATQNGMTGIAKAWINFNGTGTPAINGSFNVSSITDGGTGIYTINFTTAMPNANYSVVGVTNSETGDTNRPVVVCFIDSNSSTSGAQVRTVGVWNNNTRVDVSCCTVAVFSS
jgi:hypothetical protein